MRAVALDHLVLTVRDVEATVAFYTRLGLRRETFGDGRVALRVGDRKIDLHQAGSELAPHARVPTPGSADLCLIVDAPIEQVAAELREAGLATELGPVARTGATHALTSLYLRDPDGNLVELAERGAERAGDDGPDPRALLDPVRAYLAAPRCAVLATVGPDGAPREVVLHYAPASDHLLLNGDAARRWVANLRRDPRVSLVVHDAARPLHWVGIRGVAQVVREGGQAVEDAMALARRYDEDPSGYEGRNRVSVKVVPRRVFEYGAAED